ncbi:LysR family transcriptional regulator [Escherichia coli]|nr:LysR family transcriptional regulator [Escherichia coli]
MKATSEELAIFVSVVESGSFSRAAEQLGQANSAVSRAVKKLEMKLGVSLLNRTTRQLSLTEEGERYFRRVQSICRRWQRQNQKLWRRVIHRVDCCASMPQLQWCCTF